MRLGGGANIAIISSRLQMLNLFSFLDQEGLRTSDVQLILLLGGEGRRDSQLVSIADGRSWGSCRAVARTGRIETERRRRPECHDGEVLIALGRWHPRFPLRARLFLAVLHIYAELWLSPRFSLPLARLILGDLRDSAQSWLRPLMDDKTSLVGVDDGRATVTNTVPQRKEGFNNGFKGEKWRPSPPHLWPTPIHFYSLFVFEPPASGDLVTLNRRLESSAGSLQIIPGTFILGAPWVEMGVVEEEEYLDCIREVVAESSHPWFYFPHGREDEQKITALATRLDLQVERAGMLIEESILERKRVTRSIYSFPSSALFFLSKILPLTANLYAIDTLNPIWHTIEEENGYSVLLQQLLDIPSLRPFSAERL